MNEEFEKWIRDWCAKNPNPDSEPLQCDIWTAAWQASRKQALNDAFKVCQTKMGARGCELGIRELMKD